VPRTQTDLQGNQTLNPLDAHAFLRSDYETLVCRLFRDSVQFCSGLVDLVVGVRHHGGGICRRAPPPDARKSAPITPPDPDWDCELTKAWPEIERLAESLLNGESPIDLSNGQRLVRDEDRDYWSDRWNRLTAGSVRACWKHCGYFGAARRRPRSPEHCCRPREGLRGIAGRGAQPQISLAGRSAQPQMRRR